MRGGKMNTSHRARWWRTGLLVAGLCSGRAAENATTPQKQESQGDELLMAPRPAREKDKNTPESVEAEVLASLPQPAPSILPPNMNQVDLPCVLRLAGINNPEILIARQRVL